MRATCLSLSNIVVDLKNKRKEKKVAYERGRNIGDMLIFYKFIE